MTIRIPESGETGPSDESGPKEKDWKLKQASPVSLNEIADLVKGAIHNNVLVNETVSPLQSAVASESAESRTWTVDDLYWLLGPFAAVIQPKNRLQVALFFL